MLFRSGHIFWRAGREGKHSEQLNDRLRKLSPKENRMALFSTAILVGTIVLLGLWPNLLFTSARTAALDLLQPARYVSAVGLEPLVTP